MLTSMSYPYVIRWIATVISLLFGIRKLYRWLRKKFRNKRKTTAK